MPEPLRSVNGKFYVGMKRAEVRPEDRNEFDKINTDGNNELSAMEICDYRDKECSKLKNEARVHSLIGIFAIFMGGRSSSANVSASSCRRRASEEQKITNDYRELIKNNNSIFSVNENRTVDKNKTK